MVMADLAMGFALTLLTTVRTKALLRIVASSKANARLANGLVDPPPMLDRRGPCAREEVCRKYLGPKNSSKDLLYCHGPLLAPLHWVRWQGPTRERV